MSSLAASSDQRMGCDHCRGMCVCVVMCTSGDKHICYLLEMLQVCFMWPPLVFILNLDSAKCSVSFVVLAQLVSGFLDIHVLFCFFLRSSSSLVYSDGFLQCLSQIHFVISFRFISS